ncbi:MAG: CPBP family intramembrane metalloprotease [Cyclobacteriaceae bacterium]
MKTLWKKTPVWIKAILLNILWLYPVIFTVRIIIETNLRSKPTWGWGLILIIGLLVGYWYLAKKTFFKADHRIQLISNLKPWGKRSWLCVLGIVSTLSGISLLSAVVLDVQSSAQLDYIVSFKAYSPIIAIPLLMGLALSAGVVEEILYRGIIQNMLTKYASWVRYLYIAILFTAAHFLPLVLILPYILMSVIFSLVADVSKSTLQVILGHFLFDFFVFCLLYFETLDVTNIQPHHLTISIVLLCSGIIMLFFGIKKEDKTSVKI